MRFFRRLSLRRLLRLCLFIFMRRFFLVLDICIPPSPASSVGAKNQARLCKTCGVAICSTCPVSPGANRCNNGAAAAVVAGDTALRDAPSTSGGTVRTVHSVARDPTAASRLTRCAPRDRPRDSSDDISGTQRPPGFVGNACTCFFVLKRTRSKLFPIKPGRLTPSTYGLGVRRVGRGAARSRGDARAYRTIGECASLSHAYSPTALFASRCRCSWRRGRRLGSAVSELADCHHLLVAFHLELSGAQLCLYQLGLRTRICPN